ncbi:NUDIX domain-containing protein, partial [Candidatus Sumerlaeota bacterium]|nr:NUDIX domain-containing protein [Candidatus Sumerlaeota bacterium]
MTSTQTHSGSPPGHVEPKKSAAAIIVSGEKDPRVLMVRRNDKLRFMGGHHAFPGGRIDADEGTAHVVGAPDPDDAAAIHALAREIFEETGLLIARGTLPGEAERIEARRKLLENEKGFDGFLARHALALHSEDFLPAGLWITTKGSPIRFHSRYFL